MMRDRSDGDELPITKAFSPKCWVFRGQPSRMLPVGWNARGLIERGRRQVTILDRQGLAEKSC